MDRTFGYVAGLINASALKIGQTIGYSLILGFSLFGNSIIGLTVYKTPNMRKPINYLIANMAISDMLLPFFTIPLRLSAEIHSGGSWPTGGLLGQALCKLAIYFTHVSFGVSSQSLVLIALDRYVAVVFPLRSPFISRKLFPFFILATWVVALAFFCALHDRRNSWWRPTGDGLLPWLVWNLRRILAHRKSLHSSVHSVLFYPCSPVGHSVFHHPHQAQTTGASRWAVDQRHKTARKEKQKCVKDGHCYHASIFLLLCTLHHYTSNHGTSTGG